VCVRKKELLLLLLLLSRLLSLLSTVPRLGMQWISGWKGEIRYEEYAAAGMQHDVSGKGQGFLVFGYDGGYDGRSFSSSLVFIT